MTAFHVSERSMGASAHPQSIPFIRALTVVVPGLNEEKCIRQTVEELIGLGEELDALELILINDGSSDSTGPIMDELAALHPGISVVHHEAPKGLAYAFHFGLARARAPYMTLIPSDRAFEPQGLRRLFAATGTAELVMSYRVNQKKARSAFRYFLNQIYTFIMTTLFRMKARDVHSVNIYPVAALRAMALSGSGVAFQIECLVKLMRQGTPFVEVPVELTPQRDGPRRTVRLKTLRDLCKVVAHLMLVR